jgi:hypothetical protein
MWHAFWSNQKAQMRCTPTRSPSSALSHPPSPHVLHLVREDICALGCGKVVEVMKRRRGRLGVVIVPAMSLGRVALGHATSTDEYQTMLPA